jgi:hypothetical protein
MFTIFESYEFIFVMHLLYEIFGQNDLLTQALQRRDQDIVTVLLCLVSLRKNCRIYEKIVDLNIFLRTSRFFV